MPLTVCTDPVSERGLTHADSARHRDNRSRIIHNLPGRLVAKLRREVLFSAGHLQPPLPDGPYWRSAVRKARGSPVAPARASGRRRGLRHRRTADLYIGNHTASAAPPRPDAPDPPYWIWTAVQHRWHRSATVQYWAFCAVPWLEDCRAVDIRRGAGAGNPPGPGRSDSGSLGMR